MLRFAFSPMLYRRLNALSRAADETEAVKDSELYLETITSNFKCCRLIPTKDAVRANPRETTNRLNARHQYQKYPVPNSGLNGSRG